MDFPEGDWKHFRAVRTAALNRFCERVLDECPGVLDGAGTAHERYLALFRLTRKRDAELADTCDTPRRSTAFLQLAAFRRLGLVSDDAWAGFSRELRGDVEHLLNG
jgi:hypothetical protein